ncbi:threonine--tRNA ligase [Candidatus Dojkabacteria bacterium]|nr:threonine--tRNA ligase [Candidatus Dojkabacteria bacterium]
MATNTQKSKLEVMRHSFAHILACAVLRLFKDAKLGIGPAIENGFYHDFQFTKKIGQKELEKIEAEMRKIIEEELPLRQIIVPKDQAFDILHLQGQIYKTEILKTIEDQEVSFYKTGQEFMDLCRGPHVEHTGKLGAFKLTGISGVHWNNDESRPLMQRIHGIAFLTQDSLDKYLEEQKEKAEKDHKKIAARLELYTFNTSNGSGLPLWLPNGQAIKKIISDYLYKENTKLGHKYVKTPSISKEGAFLPPELKNISSRYIYPPIQIEDEPYSLKTMSLMHNIQLYKVKKRSYRQLPYKLSEFTEIFRNEKSGELTGLLNVRTFTEDTNYVFCTKKQIKHELLKAIQITTKIYEDFGLKDYRIELALKKPKNDLMNINPKEWMKLHDMIINVVKLAGVTAFETPNLAKQGGPGLNFMFEDVHGHHWKLGSINFDIVSPKLFNLKYVNSRNKNKTPYIIYRTSIGSFERFFAILLEDLNGLFPVWLSPVQVNIIPISKKYIEYSEKIRDILVENELNVELDDSPETMQSKIKKSQERMIPYMVILGEKEANNETISVRPRSGQDLGMMKINEFIEKIRVDINNKVIF